jgi:hypothetical protein
MLDQTNFKTTPYIRANEISAERIIITVDGIKPLLTHNPESMGVEVAPGKGSRVPEPEVEAEAGVYRLPDGACALKGESFRLSLIGAAPAWKAKGKRTMKSLMSHIVVVEELVPLLYRDGTPIKEYAIDARRAIVAKQGIIRRRPRFDEWSARFTMEFDPLLIGRDPRIIADILDDAGNRIGVGDYRPSRNGWFGRFRVREYAIASE